MALILGIDTGGTYTDGIIIDSSTKEIIAKAKALTTPTNLTIGIRNCLNNFDSKDFDSLSMVSLSTTLATNTIVEGRGCEVGLILLGHESYENLPTEYVAVVPGGHDIKGKPIQDLDYDYLIEQLNLFKGKVDAIAVSGLLSIRNPEHEVEVRRIVHEELGLPVICAHELTSELGLYERTVTAVLNARLLPVITQLIKAVKCALKEKEITAPLMIVKGDGSLMSEEVACEKPIETILSGPAASIIGCTYLTPTDSAFVVDVGGTTTDIALVKNGIPQLTKEGATVGGWSTRVHSAEVYTYGLGGDSYLQINKDANLTTVGPKRVIPLSYLSHEHSYLESELLRYSSAIRDNMFTHSVECYIKVDHTRVTDLTTTEKKVLELLTDGPHTYFYFAEKLNVDPILFQLDFKPDKLIKHGLIARSALTPTDILHAKGVFNAWNTNAAVSAANLMAQRMGIGYQEFLDLATETISDHLALTILESIHKYEGNKTDLKSNENVMSFVSKALHPTNTLLGCELKLSIPIIGIGAPIHAWLPLASERLNTEVIIPEHAEVANAIGAAVGKIMVTTTTIIRPGKSNQGYGVYLSHGKVGCHSFKIFSEAIEFAENETKEMATKEILKAGAEVFDLFVDKKDVSTKINRSEESIFIEYIITVTAVGSKAW